MRQILLDTETTGISPKQGHRIIEIGCVEMIDRRFTDNNFHYYINPERDIEQGAFAVHGISTEFLQDKPKFSSIVEEFIDYIKDSEIIIHNAPFDVGFLNNELNLHKKNHPAIETFCEVFDTLKLARQMHPGQKNNLDALCKRYSVDHINRELHGALLDAEILGHVYLAMTGGQSSFFSEEGPRETVKHERQNIKVDRSHLDLLVVDADPGELAAHEAFMKELVS